MQLKINNEKGEVVLAFTDSDEAIRLLEAAHLGSQALGRRKAALIPEVSESEFHRIVCKQMEEGRHWDAASVEVLEGASF